jgi:hypothetical protein
VIFAENEDMKKSQTGVNRLRLDADTWSHLVAAGEKSGLSVKEFCAEQGVSTASYYRWRQLLNQEEEVVFHPIEIETKPMEGIVVELPGGVSVRFEALPPISWLHSLSFLFNGRGI